MPRVALVLVSHSAAVARGTAEIAGQMAPDVTILAAGGTGAVVEATAAPDAGIGTSYDLVLDAVQRALAAAASGPQSSGMGAGVVVLTDLGSAVLIAEAVRESLEDDDAARVLVPLAPLVEGTVAAAVAAQHGGDLAAVAGAARAAGEPIPGAARPDGPPLDGAPADGASLEGASLEGASSDGPQCRALVRVRNAMGLHARPAALVARAVADSGARVTVNGVDGSSVLQLMALGAVGGHELTVVGSGAEAQAAVDRVVALVEGGFGEA